MAIEEEPAAMAIEEERSDLLDAHSSQTTYAAMAIEEERSDQTTYANHIKGSIYKIWSYVSALNASWTSKWWYSAVHNITAIIGAGVLSLPAAMVFLTWQSGIFILALLWLISLMTLWQMIQMHEDKQGNRFDRYHELGQHLLGRRLGLWIIVPLQLLTEIGVDTVYVLTAAKSMNRMNEIVHGYLLKMPLPALRPKWKDWIWVFGSMQLLLSQFHQLTSITWISISATVTAIAYSTIAWSTTLYAGIHGQRSHRAGYGFPNVTTVSCDLNGTTVSYVFPNVTTVSYDFPNVTTAHSVFGIFEAIGQMAFATAGHNVVLEIQATMPSTRQVPSKIAMWRGVLVAYAVTAVCYFPCASIGYWFYGNQQNDNTLNWVFDTTEYNCTKRPKQDNLALALKGSPSLVFMVNLLVVLHMFGSYQIYAMPLFDQVEIFLNHKFGIKPNLISRIPVRSLYVAFTCVLAYAVPFFGDLQAFFGGLAIVPTTFVLPGILWHFHRKPTPFSPPWLANMVAIVIGSIVTITSSTGAMRNIIVNYRHKYKLFS